MVEVPFEKGRRNDVIWVGESPGWQEEQQGKPFRGKAGQLHKECLKLAGLEYEDWFTENSARCKIEKDKLQGKTIAKILACCRENAIAPIKLLKPKAVVLMGDFALRQIAKKGGITKHRGRWFKSAEFGCWMIPVFHPSYILRNMGLKQRQVDDYTVIKEFIENGFEPPKVDEERVGGYREVDSIDHLIEKWKKTGETVAIDTESQGKDWMDPNFVMISYSISPAKGKAYNVTLYDEGAKTDHDFTITWPRKSGKKLEPTRVFVKRSKNFQQKLQSLANLLESKKIKKYMMNGNHDIHCFEVTFKREKRPVPEINGYSMDVQAAANVVDENMFVMSSLDDLQMAFTDVREDYKTEFEKKYNKADMFSVPKIARSQYANGDADVTRRVGVALRSHLLKEDNKRLARYVIKFTMPALGFLKELETNGALIDQDRLPKVMKEVYQEMIDQENRAIALIPRKVKKVFSIFQ